VLIGDMAVDGRVRLGFIKARWTSASTRRGGATNGDVQQVGPILSNKLPGVRHDDKTACNCTAKPHTVREGCTDARFSSELRRCIRLGSALVRRGLRRIPTLRSSY